LERAQALKAVVDQSTRTPYLNTANTRSHGPQQCLHLEFREVHANTGVRTVSPPEVAAAAVKFEVLWIRKLLLIHVGRGEKQCDTLSSLQSDAVNLVVSGQGSHETSHRRR
jgi:hypothetical protein